MVNINTNDTKKPKKLYKVLFVIIILIFLMIIIFMTPIFQISVINIESGTKYNNEEIMQKSGINYGMNIFMIRPSHLEKKILKNDLYIKSIDIKLKYPNCVNIIIKERKVRGYVPYSGAYLYIDEDGRILDISKSYKDKLPLVEGLDFDKAKIGEILTVKNQEAFEVVLKTANMMIKYDFIDDVIRIDVTKPDDIHIYIRYLDIMLGDLTEYDYKIRTMLEVLPNIPDKYRGFLNIKNISIKDANKYPVFTPLE